MRADPPTLINLGFQWMIQGDDNRNAAVALSIARKASRRFWLVDRGIVLPNGTDGFAGRAPI